MWTHISELHSNISGKLLTKLTQNIFYAGQVVEVPHFLHAEVSVSSQSELTLISVSVQNHQLSAHWKPLKNYFPNKH